MIHINYRCNSSISQEIQKVAINFKLQNQEKVQHEKHRRKSSGDSGA
jgi:hypothetical protein